ASGGDTTYTFSWNNGIGTGNPKYATPGTTTTYTVTATDNCTTTPATDSVTFFVRLPLTLQLPADTTICKGLSRQVTAIGNGGDSSYYFVGNLGLDSGATKTVQPDTGTTYRVILSDNCTIENDTAQVRV